MKKTIVMIVSILLVVVMTGCASVEAEFADGTKVKSQSCFMSLAELEGIWTSGASIHMTGAKSETEQFAEIFKQGIILGASGGVTP